MEDSEFQATAFGRIFGKIVKFTLLAAICYIIFLYFTRPELDLSESYFIKVLRSSGYTVYKFTDKRPPNARVAYTAVSKDKSVKINYISFSDEESCKEFYQDFLDKVEEKHNVKISRDYRIDRIASEKQSYSYDYSFYIALYSKNSIAYAKEHNNEEPKKELERVFNQLNKPTEFSFAQIQSMIEANFKKQKYVD